MPIRFYLPEAEATPVAPAVGAEWEHAAVVRRRMLLVPDASVLTTMTLAPDAADHIADQDVVLRQYVSDPLPAQTISGTVKAQLQALESNAGNNLFLTMKVYVVNQAGSAVRATLLAITRKATELATALTNRSFATTALASADIQTGDRLVVEIGAGGLPVATTGVQGHNASMRFGCAGVDLPENETEAGATFRPWIELSGLDVGPRAAFRVDRITDLGDGRFDLGYTVGLAPLPTAPSGTGRIGTADDALDESDLVEFFVGVLVTARRRRGLTVEQLVGRVLTLNLSDPTALLTVS